MTWYHKAREALRPRPFLSMSDWAEENYYLSEESAAEPGKWHTIPYQREIMDCLTDPDVDQVTFKKSSRVGGTKMLNACVGYHMDYMPCPVLIMQPTILDAKGYSNEEIAPMIRDCPVLRNVLTQKPGEKKQSQTVLNKYFTGGSLSMIGAQTGSALRRVSRRVILLDEVDAYPVSAGDDGDPVELAIKRSEYYSDRVIFAVSTPLLEGSSRITELFLEGDQRHFHMPCPSCGNMDFLSFREREDGSGHYMVWPRDEPENAHFVCSKNGCVIENHDKYEMLENGKWIADKPFTGHASFHLWAAYSISPNTSWGSIAQAFVRANTAKENRGDKLRTFVNTTLGETFSPQGQAPDWEAIYNRREQYRTGQLPDGAPIVAITCGVDVQQDRWVYEVVGWGPSKESWSLDAGLLYGDPQNDDDWVVVDELLSRTYSGMPISKMAVDSGNWTQSVYFWCSKKNQSVVMSVKGGSKRETTMVKPPTTVEIKANGKRRKRGHKLWTIGTSIAKTEIYGALRLEKPADSYPPGYCHFPEYDKEFFLQITGEHLVRVVKRGGYKKWEWQMIPGRENHFLDARVYARAAAFVLGVDGIKRDSPRQKRHTPGPPDRVLPTAKASVRKGKKKSGWMRRKRDR